MVRPATISDTPYPLISWQAWYCSRVLCRYGTPALVTYLLLAGIVVFLGPQLAAAQIAFDTNSVAPERFIAAHGSKAVAMGYASSGLELWAYPLQLVSGYEPGFRVTGNTTEIRGSMLLRRVTYEPEAIVRTYVGPDFIVKERLFVPLNEPVIFITYTVEARHSVDIVVHLTPVLDLMWPASLGGQSAHWDAAASAYVLTEGTGKYKAWIGSPDVVSRDESMNSAQPGSPGNMLAFAMRAGGDGPHSVTVIAARGQSGTPPARMKALFQEKAGYEAEATHHYEALLADSLQIATPDAAINKQLKWAQIALDQAWVCNDVLGCGLVAGLWSVSQCPPPPI